MDDHVGHPIVMGLSSGPPTVRMQSAIERSDIVKANTTPIRRRPALALIATAAALAAIIAGGTAQSGAAPAAKGQRTIKSGAGPGWPKTLHPSDFVRRVNNPWFPLKPGSKWFYRGIEGKTHESNKVHVKHKRKTILGVHTTIVHDVVFKHGKPREVTDDWYAQDRHGNVWYFGENTKELDSHGHVTSREGSFKVGKNGARPGVLFPGHPKRGQTARQEYLKGHAEDHFKILDVNARVRSPYVSSRHAVRTKEWTPLEPGIVENKYYVRGVGTVKAKVVKGPRERSQLVHFRRG